MGMVNQNRPPPRNSGPPPSNYTPSVNRAPNSSSMRQQVPMNSNNNNYGMSANAKVGRPSGPPPNSYNARFGNGISNLLFLSTNLLTNFRSTTRNSSSQTVRRLI